MKKSILLILPIVFISFSGLLFYLARTNRNDFQEATVVPNSTFQQLQNKHDVALTDLGEVYISFVHFEDGNVATLTTSTELIQLPLVLTNVDDNEFRLDTVIDSPDNLVIGDIFGLAIDDQTNYYYYSLE